VFALEWRGWRLLLAGDAEIRSWKTMAREGVLKPAHFLKVSHHGSHNGTPADDVFEAILPAAPADNRLRTAVISTWEDTYPGVPHSPTNTRLAEKGDLALDLRPAGRPVLRGEIPRLSEPLRRRNIGRRVPTFASG
jgi:beta-lactamase superfamily II metal-dependent hydrolase